MVAFAGAQKGNPSIFVRGFKIDANGGLTPISYNVVAPNDLGFFAGFTESIAAYIKANPHWAKMDRVVRRSQVCGNGDCTLTPKASARRFRF